MTVYPRWMNGTVSPRDVYVNTFIWMAIGIAVFEIGLFVRIDIAVAGLAAYLFGWLYGFKALYNVYKTAPAKNKTYETWLNIALILGWLGAASFLDWMLADHINLLFITLKAGLWLFLLPILFTVSHRMLPFSAAASLKTMLLCNHAGRYLQWHSCAACILCWICKHSTNGCL